MTETLSNAERVQVKLFASRPAEDPADLIPIFHRWIRESKVPGELLIDVADYTHVWRGPGVLLVGHGVDLYYDLGEDRPGLLFSRKRALEGDLEARLVDAIRRALSACKELEREGMVFGAGEILVRVPDRLHAPNDDDAFTAFVPVLESAARAIYGDDVVLVIEREGAGTRQPLTARLRVEAAPPVATLA
jgi:hypothetical protein